MSPGDQKGQEPQHCLQVSQQVPGIMGTQGEEHPCSLLPRHPFLPVRTVMGCEMGLWGFGALLPHFPWEEVCFELQFFFLHKSWFSIQDVLPQSRLCESAAAGPCQEQWWQVVPCHSVLARALQR